MTLHRPVPLLLHSFCPSLLVLLLSGCQMAEVYQGALFLNGEHSIETGERLGGVVVIVDGVLNLSTGARLEGDVYILRGELNMEGEVDGDAWLFNGTLRLGPSAYLKGNLNRAGGDFTRHPGSVITGKYATSSVQLPSAPIWTRYSLSSQLAWELGQILLLAILSFLSVRFFPRPVTRVSTALRGYPVVASAMGLLSSLVILVLITFMVFTLFLIPLAVLSSFVVILIIAFAGVAYGQIFGQALIRRFNWSISPQLAAAGGSILFLTALEITRLIPLAGDLLTLISLVSGVGAVLLTRMGSRTFIPELYDDLPVNDEDQSP